jgi:hypothetical protein
MVSSRVPRLVLCEHPQVSKTEDGGEGQRDSFCPETTPERQAGQLPSHSTLNPVLPGQPAVTHALGNRTEQSPGDRVSG